MTKIYEKTFSVSVPIERAWRALTDPVEMNRWFFPSTQDDASGTTRVDILGSEATFRVLEASAPHTLRYSDTGAELWPGVPFPTETTVTLEEIETGTRITLTRSGFGSGEDWETVVSAHRIGTDEGLADLVLYLETGVALPRHPMERSYHGIFAAEVPAGLLVRAVQADTFAHRLGLAGGDLLVELGGAPVFGYRELWFFAREHEVGEEPSAAWVRDGQLFRAKARLGSRTETSTRAGSNTVSA